jgi:hypothetical protein
MTAQGKRSNGRPRIRWENHIKIHIQKRVRGVYTEVMCFITRLVTGSWERGSVLQWMTHNTLLSLATISFSRDALMLDSPIQRGARFDIASKRIYVVLSGTATASRNFSVLYTYRNAFDPRFARQQLHKHVQSNSHPTTEGYSLLGDNPIYTFQRFKTWSTTYTRENITHQLKHKWASRELIY